MRDEIEPFSVPAKYPRPHLIFPVRQDFPLEQDANAAKRNIVVSTCAVSSPYGTRNSALVCTVRTAVLDDAIPDNGRKEMGARYVHIGEVGAVGLVEVIVGFEEGSASGCDDGLEQCVGRNSGWLQIDLICQGADEA